MDNISIDVEIEVTETWPRDFLQDTIRNRELILSFQQERRRIERLCQDNALARINPPENRYENDYSELADRLEVCLLTHRIVGYHCTRLTQGEIADIKLNGLRLLSPELVRQRLDRCLAEGHMTSAHREYLNSSQTMRESLSNRHGNRTDMIWFCPNRSTLQQTSGVYRLFRSWGGEAVYVGHEQDVNISTALMSIGTPCIVKCAIPFSQAEHFYPNFSERFLSHFIADDIESCDPSAAFDLYTKQNLGAKHILDIIKFSDPQFENLTGYSTWSSQYNCNDMT